MDSFIRYRGSERSIAIFDLSSRLLGEGEWEVGSGEVGKWGE
ncbi:hypothetical protein RVR34_24860 [Microcystis aeruginosa FBCC-A68]|nr:hypothetical protein [Microcystis aeruginosa]